MVSILKQVVNDSPRHVRRKIANLYGFLLTANVLV